MREKSKKFWWTSGGLAAAFLLIVVITVIYGSYFASHALPRVTVAGEPVTGKTAESLAEDLTKKVDDLTVNISLDGETTPVPPSQMGYTVDVQGTVDEVFALNSSLGSRFLALFKPRAVEVAVISDPATTDAYADQLVGKVGNRAANAGVKFDEGQDRFVVTPAVVGHDIDIDLLTTSALQAAETLRSASVDLATFEVTPKILDEQAQSASEKANAIYSVPVTVTDGISIYTPSNTEKASWVKISEVNDALETPSVDTEKASAWVKATGESTNEAPIPGIRNVNSRGDVVSIANPGAPGWNVQDTSPVAQELVASLERGDTFEGSFDYDRVENDKWEERIIADGAENLAYQAAPGEKWIDIDLSSYTVSAYEGATIVQGPIPMVPGAPLTPTVTGQYSIYMKLPSQTMRGLNVDGTTYETPDVPSVMYFYEGYALHGAYWRDSFGYGGPGGSHGCVNMPLDSASWFYNWSDIGTVVVSHF